MLAPVEFAIKYIPRPKNVIADALRRWSFMQPSALHHITRVPYKALLEEATGVHAEKMQDVFGWSNHPFDLERGGEAGLQNSALLLPQLTGAI